MIFLNTRIICLALFVKIMKRIVAPSCSHIRYSPVLKRRLDATKIYASQFVRESKPRFYKQNLQWEILGSCLLRSSPSRGVCMLSHFNCVRLCVTLQTVACQAPLSKGFCWQEYWSGFPCPPPGDLSNPGIELASPVSPALQMDSLPLSHQGSLQLYIKYQQSLVSIIFQRS